MYTSTIGNFGKPIEFRDGDKVYQIRYLDQRAKQEYEQWIRSNARQLLFEMKDSISGEEWAKEFSEYKTNCTTGKYGFHEELCQESLQTKEGMLTLACILFQADRDELLNLMIRRGEEIRLLLDEIKEESSARGSEKN